MPRKRPPKEEWDVLRQHVWERDGKECTRCHAPQRLDQCHIDHVQSGKFGCNEAWNLRTLCRRCHVLRACHRHQGMIAKAIEDEIIPPDWRSLVWE